MRVPLSLIIIEQKLALTGGTRRAALMSVPGPPLSFLFFVWQMAECLHVNPILTTQHHILSGSDGM